MSPPKAGWASDFDVALWRSAADDQNFNSANFRQICDKICNLKASRGGLNTLRWISDMKIVNYSKPIAIILISLSSSANADLSGLGGAVGGVTGSVSSGVSGKSASASASAAATASVPGVANAKVCAGASVNSESGGGCGTNQVTSPNPVSLVSASDDTLSANIVGMPVVGAGGEMVGTVKRVGLIDKQISWILVETMKNRRVQLHNAIKQSMRMVLRCVYHGEISNRE